jgi:hypothetical protein
MSAGHLPNHDPAFSVPPRSGGFITALLFEAARAEFAGTGPVAQLDRAAVS